MLFTSFIKKLLSGGLGLYSIIVVGLVIIVSGIGMVKLNFASDYKIFFDENDSELLRLEQLQDEFNKTENVFIMLEPKSGDVYAPENIQLVYELTQALWQVPYTSRVDSITNYPHSSAIGDEIVIEEFVYELEDISPDRVQYIRAHSLSEKDLVHKLITDDGRYTAVNLTLNFPTDDIKAETLEVNAAVEEILDRMRVEYPEVSFYHSGIAVMNGAFIKAAKRDFATLIPLMMICVLLATGWVLGSFKSAGLIFVVLLGSFVGSMGLAGWLGISLSAPSISAPLIAFTVIVASSIHILNFVRKRREQGDDEYAAVVSAYRHNGTPILLSHITTIIGFLSMNMSDSPPFRDLGNMVALGVVFSLLQVIFVLPVLLTKLELKPKKQSARRRVDIVSLKIADLVTNYRYLFVVGFTLIAIVVSSLSFKNQLDDNLIRYFDESVTFRHDADKIDQQFSGMYNIEYAIYSGIESGVFEKNYLTFVQAFEEWLMSLDSVIAIDSPLHRIKDLNRLINEGDSNFYRIPSDPVSAAQNFLLYEMSLPFGKDTGNYLKLDKSAMKVSIRLHNSSSSQVMDLEQSINLWLAEHKPEDIRVVYSSPAVIFAHIGARSIESLLKGAFIAMLIISIALIFVFRSLLLGVLSLIPNLLPISAAFGVWFLLSGYVSMGLAGVAAMTIGIVVDDTVHFLYQYVSGLKKGLSPEESVRRTFENTMPAIILSSMLLMGGFLLLSTSSFEKNSDLGLLTSITIFLALIFDMFLLPALAITVARLKYKESENISVANASVEVNSNA